MNSYFVIHVSCIYNPILIAKNLNFFCSPADSSLWVYLDLLHSTVLSIMLLRLTEKVILLDVCFCLPLRIFQQLMLKRLTKNRNKTEAENSQETNYKSLTFTCQWGSAGEFTVLTS